MINKKIPAWISKINFNIHTNMYTYAHMYKMKLKTFISIHAKEILKHLKIAIIDDNIFCLSTQIHYYCRQMQYKFSHFLSQSTIKARTHISSMNGEKK